MFIAMNRFKVYKDATQEFEQLWLGRDSHLGEMPGFVEFHMLRGPEHEDHVLYASHTVWESREAFEAWTRSEQFRKAHSKAPGSRPLYLSHPQFEGFETIQTMTKPAAAAAE
ncbi:MAG: antibiotic biosynthesis monooxygenase [Methylobacterium frigidaeris]